MLETITQTADKVQKFALAFPVRSDRLDSVVHCLIDRILTSPTMKPGAFICYRMKAVHVDER